MKVQYLYQAFAGKPIRSFCTLVPCNEALVKAVLQIAHMYEHKQAHTNTDRLKDVSPSPLLDDTTCSGEPQDWKTYK